MKKVLIISSSYRKNGNSETLARAFQEGASSSGHQVEFIRLAEKTLGFCKGCFACKQYLKCVISDDGNVIADKMKEADVIVYATPVYYYSISGQLKTLFDRANNLYTREYNFRDIYLLATAAEDDAHAFEGAKAAVAGWVECFDKSRLAGTVFAGGVDRVGDIAGHKAVTEAYEAGRNV